MSPPLHRRSRKEPYLSYPLKLILERISTFDLRYSLTETQRVLRKRCHRDIPERTISSWLTEYRLLTTYARLRSAGRKLFRPDTVMRSHTFHHQQVYRFQVHRAKLEPLAKATPQPATRPGSEFSPLKTYLESIETRFPHDLFQATGHRSSKFSAEIRPPVTRKENHATRLAGLALPTAPNNKKRHETLQRFMLINDSVTVPVEIPVLGGRTRQQIVAFEKAICSRN